MFELIGETLRRIRKDHDLTLDELGKVAGLGRGQLSRIENNHQEATLSTLAKILDAQGVTRTEFFRRYDLVESELRSARLQQADGERTEDDWPEEIREVLSKVESVVQLTFQQPRPVAQGAVEVGDWVVLFRVMPKDLAPAPAAPAKAKKEPAAGGAPRAGKPGRKRKR
jgi:transcriptional regulator with XRE-family HTH domain